MDKNELIEVENSYSPGYVVAVVENHVDISYCPSCAGESVNVWVEVDGGKVWEYQYAYDSPFALLQNWLTEDDDE